MPAASVAGYGGAGAAPSAPSAASTTQEKKTEEEERQAAASSSTWGRSGGGAGGSGSSSAAPAGEQQVAVSRHGRRPSGGSAAGSTYGQADERRGQAARPPAAHQAALVAQPSHTVPGAGEIPAPMNNYSFFVKYTYSNECALLAYNFHELVTKLRIFERFAYRNDHRLISVTLAYIFYRYQVHHCDMALDLAVTLVYLEDIRDEETPVLPEQNRDAFNLICYLAFLAHAFNADRTIRLSDWYREIGWRSFRSCQQLNGYVYQLFADVRKFRLRVQESRVKRYIQKLCSVPTQIADG